MSCFLDQNFTLDCRTGSTGGLKSLHILGASGNTISGYTTNASEQVTAFSGAGTWYSFQLPKQSASLTETIGVNETAQSVTFQPALSINLPKLDAATRQIFVDLVALNNVYAIVEDNNNRYWFVFLDNGGVVSEGTLQSGQAYTDLNGVSGLVISGGEPTSIREIDLTGTDIATLAAAGGFTWNP
jgi:hypothetical protein